MTEIEIVSILRKLQTKFQGHVIQTYSVVHQRSLTSQRGSVVFGYLPELYFIASEVGRIYDHSITT